MKELLDKIRDCRICESHLTDGVRPVLTAHSDAKVIIIGQAPGIKVHQSGIPWDDQSGIRLRDWLGVNTSIFYDEKKIALVPMGFCYPGKGKTGDLPPRKECAPQWHTPLFKKLTNAQLVILIGKYAQDYYLNDTAKRTLTETVMNFDQYLPDFFVLPHPSPRNNIWMKKNPWFEKALIPKLRELIKDLNLSAF